MKKFLYSTIILSLALSANADTMTFYGIGSGGGERTQVTGTSKTTDIILDSSNGIGYAANDAVVKSIKVINGAASFANAIGWNANKGITVDINSATGDVDAITAGNWTHNLFTLTIKNSVANSTATANLSFDTLTLSSKNSQNARLIFDGVNANVTTVNATNLGDGTTAINYKSTLSVDANSTVEWNGDIINTVLGVMDIAGNYTHNSKLTLQSGSQYNASGTITQNGVFNANSGANINITGKHTQKNAVSWANGANVSITGEFAIDYENEMKIDSSFDLAGKITQTSISGDNGIKFTKAVTLLSGSSLQAHSKIFLDKGASLTVNEGAYINITKDVSKDPRLILDKSTLTLNEENCLVNESIDIGVVTMAGGEDNIKTSKIYLNASQKLRNMYAASFTIIEMYMADDITLTLTLDDQNALGSGEGIYKIYNFREDSIYVGLNAATNITANNYVFLYDAENNLLGNAFVTNNGYLSLLQTVPEPAEWAMLLGAIALGLAIYRRRFL